MRRKNSERIEQFLAAIAEAAGLFEWPLKNNTFYRGKIPNNSRKYYYQTVWQAKKKGLLREVRREGKKFLELTSAGQLKILVSQMDIIKPERWDGKWRMVAFDIPEEAHEKRDHLRRLLKQAGFQKLQASLFINPYPLNRQSIEYLKKSGLMSYVRVIKVEEMDSDLDLRKKFNL